jgi:hypothetical protein
MNIRTSNGRIRTKADVVIGGAWEPTTQIESPETAAVDEALRQWARRSGNDSDFAASGALHPLGTIKRSKRRSGAKRLKRSVHKALRSVVAMFISPRAPWK